MMRKLMRNADKSVYMYLAVGLTAFVVEFVLFSLLFNANFLLLVAQTLSFSTGLAISFLGNRNFTFKAGEYTHSQSSQLWRYISLALFNLVFSNLLIYALVEPLDVQPYIAKVVVMAAIVVWNYLIFSKVIFRKNVR